MSLLSTHTRCLLGQSEPDRVRHHTVAEGEHTETNAHDKTHNKEHIHQDTTKYEYNK